MGLQRSKRSRTHQKIAEFLGLPRDVAHPSHTAGIRRYERAQKRRKELSGRVLEKFI